LARRDSLTGLFNRRTIDEHLEDAVRAARLTGRPLSIIMADLDHFKHINDLHGHGAGDEVLRVAADRMGAALRDSDWVGRYGGEEFLVVLRDATLEIATEIAQRVRANVASEPVRAGALTVGVTISQGVATLAPGEDVIEVVRRADEALYAAKARGRDRVVAEHAAHGSAVPRAS
ncbi:MAG: GGDEF domain-containing protein, partial [Polyangiales bacterium]